jgi:hypothetical protein
LAPFGQSVSEEKIFLTLAHQKKELILGQFLFLIGYCLKKSSPLKLLAKMEPNLAGNIYVRSSIKLLHLVPLGQQAWSNRMILKQISKGDNHYLKKQQPS